MKKYFSYECLRHLFLLNSKIVHLSLSAEWDRLFWRSILRFRSNRIAWTVLLTTIFNVLFFAHLGFAQSNIKIEGHVYDDDDGHSIPKAIIRILNTNYECKSGNSGYFHLEKIPVGTYTLEISSSGYENKKIPQVPVNVDVTTQIDVRLKKRIYFLPGLEVVAERVPIQIKSVKIIERKEIEKMQTNTISEVIESVSGVFVQKSGTVAGAHQVSIRGSSPKHVLILLDGQKINPSGTGVADLNTIPLEIVEKIEILKGGQSAIYGADALGGVINIITLPQKRKEPSKLTLGNHWGKWETEIFNSSFSNTFFKRLFTKFAYTHQYTKNDFEIWVYDNPKKRERLKKRGRNGDSTTTRKNAYKKASNFFVAANYPFSSTTELSFSGHIYQAKNGLPGSYGWMVAHQRAWAKDERRLLNLKLAHRFSPDFFLESNLGYSHFKQHFQNDTITCFDSKYVDDIIDFFLLAHIKIYKTNQLKIGTQFQKDVLNHTNLRNPDNSMGKIKRETFGAFFSDQQQFVLPKFIFLKNLNFNFALRWDHSEILKDFLSPQVGLALSRGERYRITLKTNYGKSYRQPSNNALFWKEDVFAAGDADLLPEKSEHSEAGAEVHLPWLGNLSGGMTYFHNFVKDLIEWHRRFDGRYHPVNISRTKIYGHEDFISWKSPKDILEVNYNNTVCYAKNKSGDRLCDGKFIPFRPRYLTNLSFKVDYKIFEILYKIRWVSERFIGPANVKGEEPYHLEDLSLGLKKRLWRVDTKLRWEWRNLNDEEYKLIYRHPMPGR
ncbi:MAG: TonB-dependent receptor, partial [candidate division Zixibacteria bacterium]|nr:TonB-dependent receptor [candidate division Zixibacteria bacterium]